MKDEAFVEHLLQEMGTVEKTDLQKLLDTLTEKLLGHPANRASVGEAVDELTYKPLINEAYGTPDNDQHEHQHQFVLNACELAKTQTHRTRRALYTATAGIFLMRKNSNPYAMGEFVYSVLNETMSDARERTQIIRSYYGLVYLEGDDPETVAQRQSDNDFISRSSALVQELEKHFGEQEIEFDRFDEVLAYLGSRDRKRLKSTTWAMAQIVGDPDTADAQQEAGGADGNKQDGDGGDPDGSGDGESENGDGGEKGDAEADATVSPQRLSKIERMLLSLPGESIDTLTVPFFSGQLVAVVGRMEVDRSFAPLGAIQCDVSTGKKIFPAIQASWGLPRLAMALRDTTASVALLDSPSTPIPSTGKKQLFEPAKPAAVFTIEGSILTRIVASDTGTGGAPTIRITMLPDAGVPFGNVSDGDYITTSGLNPTTLKVLSDAIPENFALVRVEGNDPALIKAVVITPDQPNPVIEFRPYDAAVGGTCVYTHVTAPFTTIISLTLEHLIQLREFASVAFLKNRHLKHRSVVIKVHVADGKLQLEIPGHDRFDQCDGVVRVNGGDTTHVLALDVHTAINSLKQVPDLIGARILINSDGFVGIDAVGARSDIQTLIPPVLEGTIARSTIFAERYDPSADRPWVFDIMPPSDGPVVAGPVVEVPEPAVEVAAPAIEPATPPGAPFMPADEQAPPTVDVPEHEVGAVEPAVEPDQPPTETGTPSVELASPPVEPVKRADEPAAPPAEVAKPTKAAPKAKKTPPTQKAKVGSGTTDVSNSSTGLEVSPQTKSKAAAVTKMLGNGKVRTKATATKAKRKDNILIFEAPTEEQKDDEDIS